ncbi:hypothetical protein QOZ80_8AG0630740 [Eleusine coracana subsp. coracana]|nr:hypothetical protein QOZ80_8AG0630740 [Eleusine coracana subsp. coracana]
MAVADAALPFPRLAAARNMLARLTHSRFGAAAADAVICSFLSSIWILLGSFLAIDVGILACGVGCPVVDASIQVVGAAVFSLVFVTPVALLLLIVLGAVPVADLDEEKAPSRKSFAAVTREMLHDPVVIGFLLSVPFTLLLLVGALLKEYSPAKGSRKDRIGSLIADLGALVSHALYFFIHPISALRLWRAWRVIRLRQWCISAV